MEINYTIYDNSFFSNFSEDLIFEIFKPLSPLDLLKTSLVSQLWKSISDHDVFWRWHAEKKWLHDTKIEKISWKEHYQANYNGSFFGSLNLHLGTIYTTCHRTIRSLDLETFTASKTKNHHKSSINQMMIYDKEDPNNIKFITCGADGYVIMWDHELTSSLISHQVHERSVTCMEAINKCILTGSEDQSIKVWEIKTPTDSIGKYSLNLINTLEGHTQPITCLQLYKTGRSSMFVFSASRDKTIMIWETTNLKQYAQLQILKGHTSAITCLKVHSQKCCLISGSIDKTIKIWNKNKCNVYVCTQTLNQHRATITSFLVNPYAGVFYSIALDGNIIGWKFSNEKNKWLSDSITEDQYKKDNKTKLISLKFTKTILNATEHNQLYSISTEGKLSLWNKDYNSTSLSLEKELHNLT